MLIPPWALFLLLIRCREQERALGKPTIILAALQNHAGAGSACLQRRLQWAAVLLLSHLPCLPARLLLQQNIDTDQIIPAEYLTLVPSKPDEYEKLGSYALCGLPDDLYTTRYVEVRGVVG